MVEFAGQTVAVVGAASGIGRAAATELAGRGAKVVCLDVQYDLAKAFAAELGQDATAVEVDVTSQDSVRAAFAGLDGDLHALVNCAGTTGRTGHPTHEVDVDDFDFVYRVNLRGALLLSQAVLPGMAERGYGRILHVASIAGKEGNAGMAAYSATKAGLIGLVKSMGKEYATNGVTVNALAPAVIQTPMVDAMPEHQVRYMTDKIPMGRLGTLDEAARMIAWIVSADCSFSTGFTFDLTGGRAVY